MASEKSSKNVALTSNCVVHKSLHACRALFFTNGSMNIIYFNVIRSRKILKWSRKRISQSIGIFAKFPFVFCAKEDKKMFQSLSRINQKTNQRENKSKFTTLSETENNFFLWCSALIVVLKLDFLLDFNRKKHRKKNYTINFRLRVFIRYIFHTFSCSQNSTFESTNSL